ncbi:MAG: hypothetical protein A3C07_01155 [Candidatus Sungbacteria bacterium RIFCSPHIGHO2_02_FULL_47_11]|uniref:Uncharacterized protein n=1 Tax=Candidatus Sungbacteria bacterium RIFCSPHIGHO2_02_FULL_47_11 TaxID=1802270 RepID=A0A1G2KJA2_9BACT|nr:MAG: hypothetical protein A3C07_01155 [Candidatus Sungbacteria bacterium RIFCSPHIGHO2_02_FULL_47_11]
MAILLLIPLRGFAAEEKNFFDPNRLLESFKQNITIPFNVPKIEEKLSTPQQTLERFSPQLQEINTGVREEIGIDFAKFVGWISKVFTSIFRIFTTILEAFSGSLGS